MRQWLLLGLLAVQNAVACLIDASSYKYDLSSLGVSPYSFTDPTGTFVYDMLFCGNTEDCSNPAPAGTQAAMCQISIYDKNVFGNWDTATWKHIDSTTFSGQFTGATCTDGGPPRETTVTFTCSDSVPTFVSLTEVATCQYSAAFTVPSSICAQAKGGLSSGSVFLIIFFVGGLLVFVGGVAFRKFKMGISEPKELLPFQNTIGAVVGLVKDGFVFTYTFVVKNKCKRATGTGYDEVA